MKKTISMQEIQIKLDEIKIEKTEKEENVKVNPDPGILIRLDKAREFYKNLLLNISDHSTK